MAFVLRGGGYTTTVRRRYPPRPRAYAVRQSRLRRFDYKDVRIYLNGVIDDAHAFKLAAVADNYLQQNKMLEFQVKKYEVR